MYGILISQSMIAQSPKSLMKICFRNSFLLFVIWHLSNYVLHMHNFGQTVALDFKTKIKQMLNAYSSFVQTKLIENHSQVFVITIFLRQEQFIKTLRKCNQNCQIPYSRKGESALCNKQSMQNITYKIKGFININRDGDGCNEFNLLWLARFHIFC